MIPLFRPTIRRADMDAVLQRLATDAIGSGKAADELAAVVAKYEKKRDGVALRSIRTALMTALDSLSLDPESRIGLSILSPVGLYAAVAAAGHIPVPLDVSPSLPILETPLNVDYGPYELDALLIDTRLGFIPDFTTFRQMGIPLIEVISEGFGGFMDDELVGSVGDYVVIGLEPEHILTAGGGALCLSDSRKRVSEMRKTPVFRDEALPDMNAALGLVQMHDVSAYIERRQDLARRYVQALQPTANTAIVQAGDGEIVYPCFPVRISASPVDVQKYASGHGVSTSTLSAGTILEYLRETDEGGAVAESFPRAIVLSGNTVLFPLYPAMRREEQETILRVLATLP